ncbi:MAG TPA: transcriptional regulator [Steroidobacteraceae bacterium]
MSSESGCTPGTEVVFGPFRLLPRQRLLYRANTPVRIGSRAREILIVLVERAGEIVRKGELLARVWPHTIVEDGTLRVHVASLRKALKDGEDGLRIVENVTGIGYRFVAPLSHARTCAGAADGATLLSIAQPSDLQQLREENARLRRVVADLMLEKRTLEESVGVPRHHHMSRRQTLAPS